MAVLNKFKNLLTLRRWCRCYSTSTLFVSDSCTSTRPIFNPTPDLDLKLQNLTELKENLKARRLDIDVDSLQKLCMVLNELKTTRSTLEDRRSTIAEKIKSLRKATDKLSKDLSEKLRLEGRIVRDDLKELLKAFWEIEEKFMIEGLALPNDIHPNTPLEAEKILEEFGEIIEDGSPHLESSHLIDYRDEKWHYLKGDAALLDLALSHFFIDGLKSGFFSVNGPDFANLAVIEGCGHDPHSSLKISPLDNNLSLVGGSSLYTLSAFYARQVIPLERLPLKQFSCGRTYSIRQGYGLFGAWQRNTVSFCTVASSMAEIEREFEETSDLLIRLYKDLGWNTRVVLKPAHLLYSWESLRLSFQMYSSSSKSWIEVGSVSISGKFIPERISIHFVRKDKIKECGYLLSGVAVDIASVLACILEQKCSNLFPEKLKPYVLS